MILRWIYRIMSRRKANRDALCVARRVLQEIIDHRGHCKVIWARNALTALDNAAGARKG